MRSCIICNRTDEAEQEDDLLLYGEWMSKQNVTAHYYCLLLSTKLQQRGGDTSGILGFFLRDIRQEAENAQKRKCIFCNEKGASIFCHKCHKVFHVACGLVNRCVNQFCSDFRSYCENCAPRDDYQRELLANPPNEVLCDICFGVIRVFTLSQVAYGDCCRRGFTHRACMRRYAIASGYYLRCLWCRDKKFHDLIKLQSVFVPDRDATWERQPNAYIELHSKRLRCDQEQCLCPNGRDYNKYTWIIKLCVLCAGAGSHLKCLGLKGNAKSKSTDFKCQFCKEVELKLNRAQLDNKSDNNNDWQTANPQIDKSFYLHKEHNYCTEKDEPFVPLDDDSSLSFSDASMVTVILSPHLPQIQERRPSTAILPKPSQPEVPAVIPVIELLDTPPLSILKTPLLLGESFTSGDYFYLVVYEHQDEEQLIVTGTCTLRFALNDERIKDRSEQALQQLQVFETDVFKRETNRGIYDEIDQFILSLEKTQI